VHTELLASRGNYPQCRARKPAIVLSLADYGLSLNPCTLRLLVLTFLKEYKAVIVDKRVNAKQDFLSGYAASCAHVQGWWVVGVGWVFLCVSLKG